MEKKAQKSFHNPILIHGTQQLTKALKAFSALLNLIKFSHSFAHSRAILEANDFKAVIAQHTSRLEVVFHFGAEYEKSFATLLRRRIKNLFRSRNNFFVSPAKRV
jgi:hypothetical protein